MSIKKYARFNNFRKNKFELVTAVEKTENSLVFVKYANNADAAEFLDSLLDKYKILKNNKFINPVKCYKKDDGIYFEKASGKSFDEILLDCVYRQDIALFKEKINSFNKLLKSDKKLKKNVDSEFKKVYGENKKSEKLKFEMMSVGCVDFIFDNIFYDEKQNKYTLIDYEWIMPFTIPCKYVLWRSLYAFYQKNQEYKLNIFMTPLKDLYSEFDISDEEREVFIIWEYNFQKYVQDFMTSSVKDFRSSILKLETDVVTHNKVFLKATCEKMYLENRLAHEHRTKSSKKIKNICFKMKHMYLKARKNIISR